MSGLFTKSLYDECNNRESLNISTGPGKWSLNTSQQSDAMCFSQNGPRNTRTGNSSVLPIEYPNAVDIESALKGLDVPLSRCMSANSLQERDATMNKMYNEAKKRNAGQNCNNFLDMGYTRLEEPARITEKSFNRYGFPIINPNEWTFNGFNAQQFNSSTEGNVRDGRSTRYDTKAELEKQNREMRTNAGKFQKLAAINS
jgi:hypothetical protein